MVNPKQNIFALTKFRGDDINIDTDIFYKSKIYRYSNIEDIEWDLFLNSPNIPVRIILWERNEVLPVDFLFIPRKSRNILVGFHGAEVRPNADLPKFQFVGSFLNETTDSLIFFSDSTLLLNERLVLGWMAGNTSSHLLKRATSVLKEANRVCGFDKTTLVGHSGGGFTAIAMGSQIPNSLAISINGQVSIGHYEPWTVRSLHENVFSDEISTDSMLTKYADRLDLRVILENRLEASRFIYYAHREDKAYTIPSFKLLADYLNIPNESGETLRGDKLLLCNWRILGNSAHALPGTVIPFMQYALGEKSKIDLGI